MKRHLLSACLVVVAVTSCGESLRPPPGELIQSQKQRITEDASSEDAAQATDNETAFALDVYRELKKRPEDNIAFSPRSITAALAMTYAGARGETAKAFETTLHQTLPHAQFHRAMNSLDRALASRGEGASGTKGRPFRLRQNNQLFTDKGFDVLPVFLDVLAQEYGAGVRRLDFVHAPEPSRHSINEWVSHNTEGLIPELLPSGSITPATVLALVNTLYFNASWAAPFAHEKTTAAPFTLSDGTIIQVPTMRQENAGARYVKHGDVDVVELPYQGNETSMVLLVPAVGKLDSFENSLTVESLQSHLVGLENTFKLVHLPKFKARTAASLLDVLTTLGLGIAFGGAADFTGINSEGGIQISDVIHQAVVQVDEEGTEAAAATAVIGERTSLPDTLEVNRPFLFLIQDKPTGMILFLGRIAHP